MPLKPKNSPILKKLKRRISSITNAIINKSAFLEGVAFAGVNSFETNHANMPIIAKIVMPNKIFVNDSDTSFTIKKDNKMATIVLAA